MEMGKDKKMSSIGHHYKDPKNHYNHCNIDSHTKEVLEAILYALSVVIHE